MIKSIRLLKIALVVTLLFVFLQSCNDKTNSIKIGYIPIAECAPLYVALENGYFEEVGLEVELVSLAGGARILEALNTQSVDVGFSNVVSLVLQRAVNNADFFSIYGATYETLNHQNHGFFFNTESWNGDLESSINSETTIAVNTRNNIEELMMRKFLSSKDIDLSLFEFIAQPFPQMLPLLENNSIDGAALVEPFVTIAKNDDRNVYHWVANQYLATTSKTLVATYVTSSSILSKKENSLNKFREAMDRANEFISNNESRTRELIGNYTKIPDDLLMRINLSEFEAKMNPSDLDSIISDMKSYDFIDDTIPISSNDLIYN